MSVKQRSDGKWFVDVFMGYKPGGGKDRATKVCATEAEALACEERFKFQKSIRTNTFSSSISLPDFVNYVFWPKKKHLRTDTVAGYRRDLNNVILPFYKRKSLNEINYLSVQEMISTCSTRKVASNARETLSSILSFAVDMELIPYNPASGRHFVYPAAGALTGMNKGQILSRYADHVKLLDHVRKHHEGELIERLVVLGLCFGMRPEEVIGVDVEACGDQGIQIYQVYKRTGGLHLEEPKTPKAFRCIPYNEYALGRITAWEKLGREGMNIHGKTCHPLCYNSKLTRCSAHTQHEQFRMLRAEEYDDGTLLPQVTQWSLRHSFGSAWVLDAKKPVETLSRIMGHVDVATTRSLYVVPQQSDLADAMSGLDDIYAQYRG